MDEREVGRGFRRRLSGFLKSAPLRFLSGDWIFFWLGLLALWIYFQVPKNSFLIPFVYRSY